MQMRGKWFKGIGVLLCTVMLLTLCAPMGFAIVRDPKEEFATGEAVVFMNLDFENEKVGAKYTYKSTGFDTGAITSEARFYVEEDTDGNNVLKAYHGNPTADGATARSPRVEKTLQAKGLTNLKIEFDLKSSGGASFMNFSIAEATENKVIRSIKVPTEFKEWTHVEVLMLQSDAGTNTFTAQVYINGEAYGDEYSVELGDREAFRVRYGTKVELDGSWLMFDNFKLSTTDKNIGGMFGIDGNTINWDEFEMTDEKTGLADVMRKTHPRIFVTDWQGIRDRIQTDENMKAWADTVIAFADSHLNTSPVEYTINVRGNINEDSTEFKDRVVPIAAAYCITGDTRYKDRVYKEMVAIGNWPDWGAAAWLCTAHILYAYGVCYDWLYNDFTPEQREELVGYVRDQGFKESVLAYECKGPSHTWVDGGNAKTNWCQVCNGSNLVAAIAFADELPEIADYIYAKVAKVLPPSLQEISADGAYAEPLGYWDYGVRHLVKAMAALDSCVEDGKSIPACLDFKNVRGVNNTSDFPIYYNGTNGAFSYGDGVTKLVYSPSMFYFANKYNKPQYAWYPLNMMDNNPNAAPFDAKNAAHALVWYNPDNVQGGDLPLDKFYSSDEPLGANGISMRSSFTDNEALVVMARGGDETAAHANLDAGGFVLDWAGKRWVHMYGRLDGWGISGSVYSWPNYHTKREKNGRYQYYHTRGEANNTIIANPQQDMPDMNYQYYAQLVRSESGENTAFGIIDMTDTNKDYTDAKRGFMLTDNRSRLVIQDEIKANKPSEFYWFANTHAEITLAEDGKSALLEYDGDKMLVRITQGPADACLGIMQTRPLPTSPNPDVQIKIDEHKLFVHTQNAQTLNLTVEFVPLAEGEGIPAPLPVQPLASWSTNGSSAKTTSQTLGDVVALKVDNPNAYAKGAKTYVDTSNLDIKPIVQNGRTLVPVRFISENIGATVGWDDATQTVSIKTKAKSISLQLGSDQMIVDGKAITLDVPAQEIGGRTLIPLRALVEALGKQVFWDDRGLILITDKPVDYEADKINKIIDLLDIRVQADGKEIKFFDSEVYNYNVEIAKGAAVPTLSVLSDKEAVVVQGNPATATIDGKTYTFNFVENAFEGLIGTGSENIVKKLKAEVVVDGALPQYQTYLSIASAKSSIEWTEEKYPMTGTYDGIISNATVNRWSADGEGSWIMYDLGKAQNLHSIAIAGYRAISRSYEFRIETSVDGENWQTIHEKASTTSGVDHDVYSLGDVNARYVRITGLSATDTTWIGINEVRIYESAQMEADDQSAWNLYFYTDSINAKAGSTLQLAVTGENASGMTVPVALSDVVFTSDNPSVASVDANGVVTLHKAGSTKLRAVYELLGIRAEAEIPVLAE